jgi:anaerobic selenocysteine-containing dehydrogenase
MFAAMHAGRVKGMLCIGQNPATSLNAKLEREALRKLDWLVVKDNWIHETANFWKTAPEVTKGEVKPQDIKTEVFFFPVSQVAEDEGTYTNTQRLLQFHFKAAEAPGDCRSDTWFVYQLGKRLKQLYASSTQARDEGWKNLVWEYEHEEENERKKGGPSNRKILKEINGFMTDDPSRPRARFRGVEGRRFDDMRVVDLLGGLSGAGQEPRGTAHAGPAGNPRRTARLGLGLAIQPASHVQPRLGGSQREPVEREEEVGVVGRGAEEVDRL